VVGTSIGVLLVAALIAGRGAGPKGRVDRSIKALRAE
jgi:hypothetical protein